MRFNEKTLEHCAIKNIKNQNYMFQNYSDLQITNLRYKIKKTCSCQCFQDKTHKKGTKQKKYLNNNIFKKSAYLFEVLKIKTQSR